MIDRKGRGARSSSRRHRVRGAVAALVVVPLVAAGCGDGAGLWGDPAAPGQRPSEERSEPAREPHVLVFEGTGTGSIASATYVVDGEETRESGVALPWRKTFSLPADGRKHEWRLVIEQGAGDLSLVVTVDDRVVARGGGSGGGTLTFSGSLVG